MITNRYTVLPKASFRPNKIVFYNQFIVNSYNTIEELEAKKTAEKTTEKQSVPVKSKLPVVNTHNFTLSVKASKRIKEKVSWLYELAKSKTVIDSYSKKVLNFRINFITLTLPAIQKHSTSEITANCLNQFLTECKSKYGLKNYVWRLEFQANGNAHYHIVTDSYICYQDCKLLWNRCIAKLGYIRDYQQKFSAMNFEEYRSNYSNGGKIDFNTLRERYGRGCATGWDSPNTVDVRCVGNAKNISFYIAKYITKASDGSLPQIIQEREPQTTNLRLWFCSKSLSALDKIEIFMEEYDYLFGKITTQLREVKEFLFDYCKVWFFNTKDQINDCKRDLWLFYRQYSKSRGYVPAE